MILLLYSISTMFLALMTLAEINQTTNVT